MSTRESIAPRQSKLLEPPATAAELWPGYARLLTWPTVQKVVFLCGDLFAITLAHTITLHSVERYLRVPANALNPFEYHRYYIPFFAVVLFLFDGYKSIELRRPEQELERSCKAVAVSFLGLVLFNFVIFRSEVFSRYLLISWFLLATVLLVAVRFGLRDLQERIWKLGLCRRQALLIGSPTGLAEYRQLLSIQRHNAYELLGVLTDDSNAASQIATISHLPVLGSPDQWEECLARMGADLLVVTIPDAPCADSWLGKLLQRCKQLGVDVEIYSPVLATANMNYHHDEFSGSFRFYAKPAWSVGLQRMLKRIIDVVIGLVGSIVTILLIPIVFLLVNMEERGPLFYRSAYLGQAGQTCYYLKFRTMHVDADRMLETDAALRQRFREQQKLIDDPRITRVGRLLRRSSLDEFPQFFSVLVGRLTFVGPRTIRGEEGARYGPQLQKLLSVKPGVTGFWQVMGRQKTTYQERIRMDMFYVDRWSIWLDLAIIGKTFWKVVKGEGAY